MARKRRLKSSKRSCGPKAPATIIVVPFHPEAAEHSPRFLPKNQLHSVPGGHFDDRGKWRRGGDHFSHISGHQTLDQRHVLVCVGIIIVILMAGSSPLVRVAIIRVRTVAMFDLRHLLSATAIKHKPAMHPKHPRPWHLPQGEPREADMDREAQERGGYRPALERSDGISFTDSASDVWPRCG